MAQHLSTSLNEEEKRDLLSNMESNQEEREGRCRVRNQDSGQGLVELAHKPILALGRLG